MIAHSRPWITPEDIAAVSACLRSGMIASGEQRALFEQQVAELCGYRGAVATPSGTAAQVLLLRALGIGPGDQVVLPTYVCGSVCDGVRQVGAEPVLCDISGPWHMTPADVARTAAPRLKAIILVHTFGIDASDPDFAQFGVPVIDDLAQAFGLRTARAASRLAFCSLHATKCLATGEGGLALSADPDITARLASLRQIREPLTAFNDLQAVLGLSQLARYDVFLRRRRELARAYLSRLPQFCVSDTHAVSSRSLFFRFPVRVSSSPQALIERLAMRGIAARRGVDQLLHRSAGAADERFPHAVERYDTTVSIPIYPALDTQAFEAIVASLAELLGT